MLRNPLFQHFKKLETLRGEKLKMKILQKIEKALEENRPFWSFEYFHPKTPAGVQNLFSRMERM
jgi:hypothetical protein